MRELIIRELKKYCSHLNEGIDLSDDELAELIKNYSGNIKIINDFKGKILFNKPLTDKQKEAAKNFFERERLSNTILADLDSNSKLGEEVIKKGIQTYVDLIKTGKKHLFKTREDLPIKVGTPGPEWIKRNIDDLKELNKKLSPEFLDKKIKLPTGETTTLRAKSNEIIQTLEQDPNAYPGFIENGEWSIVNKIDTNYSNWFRMLAELDSDGRLKGSSPKEKVEYFFQQFPVEKILPQNKLDNLKIIENEFGVKIPTLSLADFEVLREFNKDFLNIRKRIMSSSERGEKNEINVKGTLKLFSDKAITENDIIHFSSYGNRVDQVFGIDMLVYMYLPDYSENKYWVPVQVKSDKASGNKSILLKFDIGGISIFPTKNPELDGNYGYLTHRNGTEKSLSDLMVYNNCRAKEDAQSCKKFDK